MVRVGVGLAPVVKREADKGGVVLEPFSDELLERVGSQMRHLVRVRVRVGTWKVRGRVRARVSTSS